MTSARGVGDEIPESYLSLRPEHIKAALAYAANRARDVSLLPVSGL